MWFQSNTQTQQLGHAQNRDQLCYDKRMDRGYIGVRAKVDAEHVENRIEGDDGCSVIRCKSGRMIC